MKTTPPKTSRPTAAADRPGGDAASPEPRVFSPHPAPEDGRAGLFTGGATLH